jgi:TonB family protein
MIPRLLIRSSNILACVTLILSFGVATGAQSAHRHFSRDGASFDYPADFLLNDRSDAKAQQLILTRPDISSMILVVAFRDAVLTRIQLRAVTENTTEPYIRDLVARLSTTRTPAQRDSSCATVGEASIGGIQVRGEMNGSPATAEVYAFPKGRRFINLVYIRKNAEDAQSATAWKLVRESLKLDTVESDKPADLEVDVPTGSIYAGGILNGKAISLPQPGFPLAAREAHASGAVIVEVTIDETGKVIAARAVSGHPTLRGASEEVARRAKFSPTTLCGKPVKVNGAIVYNYVLR